MPATSTPSLGSSINVNAGYIAGGGVPYYDAGKSVPSPQLGTKLLNTDGHEYIFAQASAAIASNVNVALTEPAMTMAAGTGSWQSPTITGGIPINGYAWFKKVAA